MKQLFSILFSFILLTSSALAQEISISDVPARKFKGVKELEGKGYYTFYFEDKAKKGYRDFVLKIYDYDLNEINTTKVNLPKNIILIDGVYNGENLLMGFIDGKNLKVTYVTFNENGNKLEERLDDIKNKMLVTDPAYRPRLFSGDNNTFYIVKVVKEKNYGYKVEKVGAKLDSKWVKSYIPEKGFIVPISAISENGVLAITSMKYPNSFGYKKAGINLSAFDTESGEHLFDRQLNSPETYPIPSSATVDKDGSVVIGGMYYDGPKAKSSNSDGVFLMKFNKNGDNEFFKTTNWKEGLQASLNENMKKDFLSSAPMVLFHDIENTGQGYRVIGETFKKTVDQLQTALSFAGGRSGSLQMKFSIMDFSIFEFSNSGVVQKVNFIEKEPRSVDLESYFGTETGGGLYTSTMVIAQAMKKNNFFGYRFTTEDSNGEDAIVFYNNPSNGTFSNGVPYFGIARLSDPKNPVKHDIRGEDNSFSSGIKEIGIVKNKEGKILLYNHDRSDKLLTIWLEEF